MDLGLPVSLRPLALVAAMGLLAVTGCGSDPTPLPADGSGESGGEALLPATVVDETGAEVTVGSIERIIPLDGDVAEVVFALDLGDNVVATDLSATFPPEADELPEIGYQRALSAEPIAALEPTVLLATSIAGPPEALDDIRRLGYPLVIVPNEPTPLGPGTKIRAVAAALGVADRGESLAGAVDLAIAEATVTPAAGVDDDGDEPSGRPRVMALYLRGTAAQIVLGEGYPTRWIIEAAGGLDVSAELGVVDTEPISAEAVLAAAPDVLLVTDTGLESVGGLDGLRQLTGLAGTPASQTTQVLAYDDQLLLGNGPRVAQLLAQLAGDLSSAG